MSFKRKTAPEIQLILIEAMTRTAFVCVIGYICLWIIFCVWSGVTHTLQTFFRVNACVFTFEALGIYQFTLYCKQEHHKNLPAKQTAITMFYLVSGLHWGAIVSYLIYSGALTVDQQFTLRLISIGFAGIWGSHLAIANLTGVAFSMIMIVPHLLASYWFKDPNAHFLTLLSCIFGLFLFISTRSMQKNFFLQFISSFKLTQAHADSMEHLSKKDIVTKLNNRFHWFVDFESLWNTSRAKHTPIALLGIKVNHLALINTTHGSATGDALMASVASVLLQIIEDQDYAGRYTGDTFMLTIPNIECEHASKLASDLINTIEQRLFIPEQLCVPVTLSSSVACYIDESAASMVSMVSQNLTEKTS